MRKQTARTAGGWYPTFGYGAVVLAVCLAFMADVALASPLARPDVQANAGTSALSLTVSNSDDADDWDSAPADRPNSPFAASFDLVDLGVRSMTESLKQDRNLKQVLATTTALRTLEPMTDALAEDAATATLGGAALGSSAGPANSFGTGRPGAPTPSGVRPAGPVTRKNQPPGEMIDIEEVTLDDAPDGVTLRQALRSVVSKPRQDTPSTADAITDTAKDLTETSDDGDVGLGDRILDSRTLGEALEAFVQPVLTDHGTQAFSIMGEGQFEFDSTSDMGGLSISEASTGLSVSIPLREVGGGAPPPPRQPKKVDLVSFAMNYLTTPTGTLAMITFGVLFLVWGMTRVAVAIRR